MRIEDKITLGLGVAFVAVGLFIGFAVFNSAEIHNLKHSESGEVCPDEFHPNFKLSFSNEGYAGTELCVNVRSSEVEFEQNKICRQMNSNSEKMFTFTPTSDPLAEGGELDSLDITYEWSYQKNLIQDKKFETTCKYER